MGKLRVYLESTVISFETAKPARDILLLAKQEWTHLFWEIRDQFDLFISQLVWDEIERGDRHAANLRTDSVAGIPLLPRIDEVERLVDELIDARLIPEKVRADAAHVAIASVHGMDILATWNQTHLANPNTLDKIELMIRRLGFNMPKIQTPEFIYLLSKKGSDDAGKHDLS